MVDLVRNQYRRLNHNSKSSEIGNRYGIKNILLFDFFLRYDYWSHAIWNITITHTHYPIMSEPWYTYAQCYKFIIEERKYQYSYCAYLKRLIYFQWNMHIHISIGNSVIYTPYLSLTIWHDLLTSVVQSFPP